MSEDEFQVLDNLYFVTSYQELVGNTRMGDQKLKAVLWGLIQKGWTNCFNDPENEVEVTEERFSDNYGKYYYLASKQGLLEHNLR